MNEIDHIHKAFRDLAQQNVGRKHREGHYTMVLCGRLWSALNDRMLVYTGLGVESLREKSDEETDAVRTKWLPETKDFYADLLLTDVPYRQYGNTDFCGLDRFVGVLSISHVFEFKFLNAFTTMGRKHAREDTAKLRVLGGYLKNKNKSKQMPYLEQVIFNFTAPGARPKTNEKLRSWFTDGGFREQFKEVAITIVSPDGAMEAV